MGLFWVSPTVQCNLAKRQIAKHPKKCNFSKKLLEDMQTNPWDVQIYEAGFCFESLKGGCCGLDGAYSVAGIEPHHVSLLLKTFKSFWLSQILWIAFRVQLGPRGTFSVLALFPYIKLNFGQTRLLIISRTCWTFLPMQFCVSPSFHVQCSPSPSNKILFFLENQVKCHLSCDAPWF